MTAAASKSKVVAGNGDGGGPPPPPRRSTWGPINLAALNLDPPEPPTIGRLVYGGRRHVFSGEPESLKSWAALVLAAGEIREGRAVVFVDFGEGGRRDVYDRVHGLGLSDEEIAARFLYLEPEEPATTAGAKADIDVIVQEARPSLVIFDATTGALELHGLDPNKGQDIQTFYRVVVGGFRREEAALVVIDHLSRNRDTRGQFAVGSERKIAATDVHLRFEMVVPFGRGRVGLAKIETKKDRPGFLPRPKCAELELASDRDTGLVTATWKIMPTDHQDETFRPTVKMERVSRYVEEAGAPPSRNQVTKAIGGNASALRLAIATLIAEGYLHKDEGPNRTQFLSSVRPFREAADEVERLERISEEFPF